jgi:hypothetical protein
MADYRMDLIKNGCPVCLGDIKGNKSYRYFCRKCRMFFEEDHIMNGALCKEHETKGYFF